MRIPTTVEVKSNLILTARERGKIVHRREGHNIFLKVGAEWLSKLISYSTLPSPGVQPVHPDDAAEYHRIRYIGVGIGGDRQKYPSSLFTSPPLDVWGATFTQSDDDSDVYKLETPVPFSATGSPFPNDYQWLGQVTAPPSFPSAGRVVFSKLITTTEVSFGSFALVPLSEIGLFTNAATYNLKPTSSGAMVAYDTFDSIPKNNAINIEGVWTLVFG